MHIETLEFKIKCSRCGKLLLSGTTALEIFTFYQGEPLCLSCYIAVRRGLEKAKSF